MISHKRKNFIRMLAMQCLDRQFEMLEVKILCKEFSLSKEETDLLIDIVFYTVEGVA